MDYRGIRMRPGAAVVGAFAGAALLSAATTTAQATTACMANKDLVTYLGDKYEEAPRALGLVANRSMMQVFVSTKSGTWTIVMTTTQGMSCILAAGDAWEDVKLKIAEGPET